MYKPYLNLPASSHKFESEDGSMVVGILMVLAPKSLTTLTCESRSSVFLEPLDINLRWIPMIHGDI